MLSALRRLTRSRHLAWLLALALWLPGAQWVTATHTLLHLHASVTEQAEPPEHLPESCDSCVVAAALLGAAPPPAEALPVAPEGPAATLPAAPIVSAALPPASPYRSRAPPLLPA